jgi:glycosyltransferase involved in cell wall biosynthesis
VSILKSDQPKHIVHFTSVHARYDTRVFYKQCVGLARHGYQVTLIVADGLGDETTPEGVVIRDVGKPAGRLRRMMSTTRRVARLARSLNGDLFQFHDPELFPAALILKRAGKPVVFDSHEDVPRQIMAKAYLHPGVRRAVSIAFGIFEAATVRGFDAVIAATPTIAAKFRPISKRVVNINNYPMLGELDSPAEGSARLRQVCYVGSISEARGILQLIEALSLTRSGARLELLGTFLEPGIEARARALPGWAFVDVRGQCDRAEVREALARSIAGMVALLPMPNHTDSQPVKLFEYMAAGIPAIASDFPLWREIVVGRNCGLCVNPQDPAAIAAAIDTLVLNPNLAATMGRNGQAAVSEELNWSVEERELLQLYEDLLG